MNVNYKWVGITVVVLIIITVVFFTQKKETYASLKVKSRINTLKINPNVQR
jgi:hypothetical protein